MRHLTRRSRALLWALCGGAILLLMGVSRYNPVAVLLVASASFLGGAAVGILKGSREFSRWERAEWGAMWSCSASMLMAGAAPNIAGALSALLGGAAGGLVWAMMSRGGRL